jgi:ABC-type sugar transport system substrate-binding protein
MNATNYRTSRAMRAAAAAAAAAPVAAPAPVPVVAQVFQNKFWRPRPMAVVR